MKQKFDVTGMTCAACSARVEKVVGQLAGVQNASVNLLGNSMVAEYDPETVGVQEIIAAVTQAGYGASVAGEKRDASSQRKNETLEQELAWMKRRMIWSGVFLLSVMVKSESSTGRGWKTPLLLV